MSTTTARVPSWVTTQDNAAVDLVGTGDALHVTNYAGSAVATVTPVWCDGDVGIALDAVESLNLAEARELVEHLTTAIDRATADR